MAYLSRNSNLAQTSSLRESPSYVPLGVAEAIQTNQANQIAEFSPYEMAVEPTLQVASEFDNTLTVNNEYLDFLNLGQEVTSKTLTTTFGREEDYIELHIKNAADQLIYSETNFENYVLNDAKNMIQINPEQILSDRGYTTGKYIVNLHIHRNKYLIHLIFLFQ